MPKEINLLQHSSRSVLKDAAAVNLLHQLEVLRWHLSNRLERALLCDNSEEPELRVKVSLRRV